MNAKKNHDPLVTLLCALTFTTGLVDAVSVLGLGRVFTANMTGNVVFFGFAIGGAPGFSIPRCLAALFGFVAGSAVGGYIGARMERAPRRRWLSMTAGLEAVLFFAAALAARDFNSSELYPATHLYAMIVLTAIAMGLRNATVRHLGVADLTTTVLTLTLTGLAADSSIAGGSNPRWGRRVAAVVLMFAGAAIGAVLLLNEGLAVPLLLTGFVVLFTTAIYAMHPASRGSQGEQHG